MDDKAVTGSLFPPVSMLPTLAVHFSRRGKLPTTTFHPWSLITVLTKVLTSITRCLQCNSDLESQAHPFDSQTATTQVRNNVKSSSLANDDVQTTTKHVTPTIHLLQVSLTLTRLSVSSPL